MRPMIQFYVESMRVKGRKPMQTTRDHAAEMLERIFDTWERDYGVTVSEEKITGLTGAKIQRWYNDASQRWKPATANNYVAMLNPFLRWAAKMSGEEGDYVQKDFSDILHAQALPDPDELPEEERPKDKYFTKEQVEELLHGNHGHNNVRDRALIAMFLFSGLRVSELCQVTVGNYRSGRETCTVRVQRKGGAWKNVDIGSRAYDYIDTYLKTRANLADDQPLFLTTHGQPCNRRQIYKSLACKQRQIGIATGPHALRHTAISALDQTASAGVARDVANHKSLKITNRYTHTTREERQVALNNLPWN